MTPAQIRAAKALLGWDNGDIAQRAGLSRNTVQAMQARDELGGKVQTARAVRQVLEDAGIRFIEDRETRAVGVLLLPGIKARHDISGTAERPEASLTSPLSCRVDDHIDVVRDRAEQRQKGLGRLDREYPAGKVAI